MPRAKKTGHLARYLSVERAKEPQRTLRHVAAMLRISSPYLRQLESGARNNPSDAFLRRLAQFYGVSFEQLLYLRALDTRRVIFQLGKGQGEQARLLARLQARWGEWSGAVYARLAERLN